MATEQIELENVWLPYRSRSTPTDTSTTGPGARGSGAILPLASPPPLGLSIAGVVAAYLVMMSFLQPAKNG